jgi:MFS family permease
MISAPRFVTTERARVARALVTGVGLVVAGVLPGFLTASLAPRIRMDFAFSKATVGVAVGIFYVACALISTPLGRLVGRIGVLSAMRLAAATTAISCVAVALFADSAAALIALIVVGGIGNSTAGPAASALLSREVASHRHGLAFGAQQSGASIGALFAGLALPAIAIPFGWRWAFVAAAVLAVAAAAWAPRGGDDDAGGAGRRTGPRGVGFTDVHALAIGAVLASAAGVGFISFLVLYSVDNGLSELAAGLLLGGVSLAATVSRISLGAFGDREGQDPVPATAAMIAVSVAGYVALLTGLPGLIVAGALLAGLAGWAWPAGLTLAVVRRSPESPAWAVGVLMSGLFAGAAVGPALVGVLADHVSFTAAWIACATLALLAAGAIALGGRR